MLFTVCPSLLLPPVKMISVAKSETFASKVLTAPKRVSFVQHFCGHANIVCDTHFLHDDNQILTILLQAYNCSWLLHTCLHSWVTILLFTASHSWCFFSCCLHLKAHLLHIFSIFFEHFLFSCRFFFDFTDFSSCYMLLPNFKQLLSLLYVLFLEKESPVSYYSFFLIWHQIFLGFYTPIFL